MADIDLELDALEEARAVVAEEAGRVPGLGDRLGSAPLPDVGALDASPALADAIAVLTRALVADLAAAGRLGEAERALDAAIRRVQQTDGAGAAVLASAGG